MCTHALDARWLPTGYTRCGLLVGFSLITRFETNSHTLPSIKKTATLFPVCAMRLRLGGTSTWDTAETVRVRPQLGFLFRTPDALNHKMTPRPSKIERDVANNRVLSSLFRGYRHHGAAVAKVHTSPPQGRGTKERHTPPCVSLRSGNQTREGARTPVSAKKNNNKNEPTRPVSKNTHSDFMRLHRSLHT